jgi:hypothetical protein
MPQLSVMAEPTTEDNWSNGSSVWSSLTLLVCSTMSLLMAHLKDFVSLILGYNKNFHNIADDCNIVSGIFRIHVLHDNFIGELDRFEIRGSSVTIEVDPLLAIYIIQFCSHMMLS